MTKVVFLCAAVAALFVVVLPGSGVAAKPVEQFHENFTDTFPDEVCGINGTSVARGVFNFQLSASNTFRVIFVVNQTFTASASGKSIVIHVAQQVTGFDEPIDNGNGTVTFIETYKGLPEQLRLENGRMLSRDAGSVTVTTVGSFDSDGNFTFISQTLSGEKGPHPDLDSDFEVFCDVLIPALTT